MGRWKKYPDLERRVLEHLDSSLAGNTFTAIFDALKPGSKSTLADCLRSLVAAGLIEHDYLTERFKVTDQGRQAIGKTRLRQRGMELLVTCGVFKDEDEAVKAAIHLWFGIFRSAIGGQDVLEYLPFRVDKNRNLLGPPENEEEWKLMETTFKLTQKVKRDVEDTLIQDLRVFVKRHQSAVLILREDPAQLKELWEKSWPQEAINDLNLVFISDKGLANNAINDLKDFLNRTYPKSIRKSGLEELTFEKIQTFKKKHSGPAHPDYQWGSPKA